MKKVSNPHFIKSIQEEHYLWGLPKPKHPLISVFHLKDTKIIDDFPSDFILIFYCIAIKKNVVGKIRYGQRYFDHDNGIMSFIS
ncbi:hypothetical protein [Chitinophaga sancti]|uniref:AraC family transcriptional regulator n=1 Tax=Chitinophaga sancti TaxID=1004 RepID=A0A1K1R4K7_9BACT|nr:hypothetical protein [Chitinophaga sancti]WQD64240.1 hypothetical protein U0033_07525 [Chitinophaga sancti]WQG90136.1 hypothetical protein SR876_01395 [Chitinophaga sancti]SFW67162.1 hypothetical protein SAMN05661012_03404 [Chitinophaga sancti]